MRTPGRIAAVLLSLLLLVSCRAEETATPVPTLAAARVASPMPEPSDTPRPPSTPFPTAKEVAPEKTFTKVGRVAHLEGPHGISGKAIVAGLQTLIIQSFKYDGKGPRLDVRLVKGDDYKNPAAILLELEQRAYQGEMLHMIIPSSAGPGTADAIAIYSPETDEALATGVFE